MENLFENKLVALAKMNAKLDGISCNDLNGYIKGYVKGAEDMAGVTPELTCCFSGTCDAHEYVEIAGIKWATMNVGAKKVTDYGLYFQWGDTKGYTAEDVRKGLKAFNWESYKFKRPQGGCTKYNKHDGLTKLSPCDDAVTAAWGHNWRTPTKDEFGALYNATTHEFTRNYKGSGVAGLVFRDKADPSKELFFPAAGLCDNGGVFNVGSYGYYWSSSLYSNIVYGYLLKFYSSIVYQQNYLSRFVGFPVRGVVDD